MVKRLEHDPVRSQVGPGGNDAADGSDAVGLGPAEQRPTRTQAVSAPPVDEILAGGNAPPAHGGSVTGGPVSVVASAVEAVLPRTDDLAALSRFASSLGQQVTCRRVAGAPGHPACSQTRAEPPVITLPRVSFGDVPVTPALLPHATRLQEMVSHLLQMRAGLRTPGTAAQSEQAIHRLVGELEVIRDALTAVGDDAATLLLAVHTIEEMVEVMRRAVIAQSRAEGRAS
jgi:hypothetical protein